MTEADRYLEEKRKREAAARQQAGRAETTAEAGPAPGAVSHAEAATGVTPGAGPVASRPAGVSAKAEWFSVEGRLNRTGYFLRMLILFPVGFAGSVLIDHVPVMGFPLLLAASAVLFLQAAKRLHDLNQSGWLVILWLVPVVNVGLGLWLLFAPGADGPNRFGPQPV